MVLNLFARSLMCLRVIPVPSIPGPMVELYPSTAISSSVYADSSVLTAAKTAVQKWILELPLGLAAVWPLCLLQGRMEERAACGLSVCSSFPYGIQLWCEQWHRKNPAFLIFSRDSSQTVLMKKGMLTRLLREASLCGRLLCYRRDKPRGSYRWLIYFDITELY